MAADLASIKRLRLPILLALAMAGLGATIAVAAHRWYAAEHTLARAAEVRHREAEAKLTRAREDEAQIRETIGRFNELQARGLIGPENRLDWVERIRAVRTRLKLYDLQYEISPQRPLSAGLVSAGGYTFYASTMQLSLQLLHEEDLLRFLDALRETLPAYVRLRECSLRRAVAEGAGPGPQLAASCRIDLITAYDARPNA